MAARSIGSGTISFGLVSIPVRFYVATHSEQPHFNLIHASCGSRIKQQIYCPRDDRVVERSELVKGYELSKEHYVTFTDEELKALEAAASEAIDIQEFVPLAKVDPIYFENAHYLGPDKGADKAYHLLGEAMRDTGMVALAQHVARGKEQLVLIRPMNGGLVLHTLYYADEVRKLEDIGTGSTAKMKPAEIELARKLITQLCEDEFAPEKYHDHWRERLEEVVKRKAEGETITAAPTERKRAQVIDLMDALKQSLSREGRRPEAARTAAATSETAAKRRPAAAHRRETVRGRRRAAKK
jgi:DNA end-binding protein Ku